jgi:hypothetical protein
MTKSPLYRPATPALHLDRRSFMAGPAPSASAHGPRHRAGPRAGHGKCRAPAGLGQIHPVRRPFRGHPQRLFRGGGDRGRIPRRWPQLHRHRRGHRHGPGRHLRHGRARHHPVPRGGRDADQGLRRDHAEGPRRDHEPCRKPPDFGRGFPRQDHRPTHGSAAAGRLPHDSRRSGPGLGHLMSPSAPIPACSPLARWTAIMAGPRTRA